MTTTISKKPLWGNALANPAQEFSLTPLQVITGKIPAGLKGSLYRNGPGRLTRGNKSVGHWFDGDGGILAVHFANELAQGTYQYIKTAGYLAEEKADKFLFTNYDTFPDGGFWKRFNPELKNTGNTSVIAVENKLLALWEAGSPHGLDLQTLETFGLDDLGTGDRNFTCSAHPKRDLITGDIYNIGLIPKFPQPVLRVYRSDRTGKVIQQNEISLDGLTIIHDCLLAGDYFIVFVPPLRLNSLKLTFGKTYSESLEWKPEIGQQLLIFNRHTLELTSKNIVDSWFHWHFGNGGVNADGNIVLDLVKWADWKTNQRLKEIATGTVKTIAPAKLHRLIIDPITATIKEDEQVSDLSCEFPIVKPQDVGNLWQHTYMAIHKPGTDIRTELHNAIARVDYHSGEVTIADLGESKYPVEPIYAPDYYDVNQGWILTVIYDGLKHQSEVWIYDSERLYDQPVCTIALPSIIPMGFHGTWRINNG